MRKSDLCFQVWILPDWHGLILYFGRLDLMVIAIARGMLVLIGNVI